MNKYKKSDNKDLITIDQMEYNKTPFDVEEIGKYTSENDFMKLVVEMFKEMITINYWDSNALRLDENNNPRRWTRDEAILGGMMVRLNKLLVGILEQTCQQKWELAYIFLRSAMETCVNLKYLIQNNSKELYQEFVEYSLIFEKEFLELINENILERDSELQIEKRMKKSILRSFSESGIEPDSIDHKKRGRLWNKSIYSRFKEVGWENYFLITFVLPSHAVHGNWEDLLRNHIQETSTGYLPENRFTIPRPQPLLAQIIVVLDLNKEYILDLLPESKDRSTVITRIDDLDDRSRTLMNLHEQYLQRR